MKVFLSWSGQRSREVANLLSDWLCCVIQALKPWISTRDIDPGSLWFTEINDQLKDTTVGIICLTQENKDRPWILFEAGALAKGLSTSRVCTLLVDLQPKDLEDPLAQFNHTLPTRDSIFRLVNTLNNAIANNKLDNKTLERVFETYWNTFEVGFSEIIANKEEQLPSNPRSEEDILGEILENTRMLNLRIRQIENDAKHSKTQDIENPISTALNDERKKSVRIPLDIIKEYNIDAKDIKYILDKHRGRDLK